MVRLEVTLATYGLVDDLLAHARRLGPLDFCGPSRSSLYANVIGKTIWDSVASQSRNFLPTVTRLTAICDSEVDGTSRQTAVTESVFSRVIDIAEVTDLEDISFAVLAQQERLETIK